MNPMNSKERYNEDILKELEKIKAICNNALNKVDELLKRYFTDNTIEVPVEKDKLIEDITFISHNLSSAMSFCEPLFKHYYAIPSSTENEALPYYLMAMKNDGLVQYENNLLEKVHYEEDDKFMSENEKRVKENVVKVSTNLCERLGDYRKKNKMNYGMNTSNVVSEEGNRKMMERIMSKYKSYMYY